MYISDTAGGLEVCCYLRSWVQLWLVSSHWLFCLYKKMQKLQFKKKQTWTSCSRFTSWTQPHLKLKGVMKLLTTIHESMYTIIDQLCYRYSRQTAIAFVQTENYCRKCKWTITNVSSIVHSALQALKIPLVEDRIPKWMLFCWWSAENVYKTRAVRTWNG